MDCRESYILNRKNKKFNYQQANGQVDNFQMMSKYLVISLMMFSICSYKGKLEKYLNWDSMSPQVK